MTGAALLLAGLLGSGAGLNLRDLLQGDLKQQDDLRTNQFTHVQLTPTGAKDWAATARSATLYRRSAHDRGLWAQADQLVLVAYAGSNEVLHVQADAGQVDLGRNLTLRGHVVVAFGPEGYRLQTHSLRYQVRTKKFTTPDKVVLTGPEKKWTGIGLIVRPLEGQFQLVSDAAVTGKNDRLELRAATLQVSLPGGEGVTAALARFVKLYEQLFHGVGAPSEKRG